MFRTQIAIQNAGVYLYKGPKQVWLDDVERELVIIFACPSHKLTGIVVYPHPFVRNQLFELLAMVREKLTGEAHVAPQDLQAKIFGCSSGQSNALFAAQVWLTDQQIPIQANETGRNVLRSLVVECGTGQVGVRFADPEMDKKLGFLKIGTVAQRAIRPDHQTRRILLITETPALALLAAQSVEGKGWTTKSLKTKDLLRATKDRKPKLLDGVSAVVVFEDTFDNPKLASSILTLRKKCPGPRWLWAADEGSQVPLPFDSIHLPTSQNPDRFAGELTSVLSLPPAGLAEVITLPQRRRG